MTVLPWLMAALLPHGEVKSVTLLHTCDSHGRTENMERLATRVQQARKLGPTVLVDAGDTFQGNAEAFVTQGAASVAAMNWMGYDAMALGNHDFDWGTGALFERSSQARFPLLSANLEGLPWSKPYQVVTVGGIKIGLIGLTTPATASMVAPDRLMTAGSRDGSVPPAKLRFTDPVAAARHWTNILRPQVDVVVALAHMGDAQPATFENPTRQLAAIEGLDLIVGGHTHQPVPEARWGKVFYCQAGKWAEQLGALRLDLVKGPQGWRLQEAHGEVWPVANLAPDPDLQEVLEPFRERVQTVMAEPIGLALAPYPPQNARKEETAIANLTLSTLQELTGADVAFHDVWSDAAGLPQGQLTRGQLFEAYFYENTIRTVRLTGAQLKEALEIAAQHYGQWNFASALGVRYTLDLRRPAGQRVLDLRFQGEPLDPKRELVVATNSFIGAGGGGYTPFQNAPLIHETGIFVRDAVIQRIRREKQISPTLFGHWRVIQ